MVQLNGKTSGNNEPAPVLVVRIGSHPIVYSVTTILALGALLFFFAVTPAVRALERGGKASLADAEDAKNSALELLNFRKQLVGNADAVSESDRSLLAYALPAEPDIPGLSVQIATMAKGAGVVLVGFDASQNTDDAAAANMGSKVVPLDLTMSFSGVNYELMKILLSNVENSLRIMDVTNANFSPEGNSANLTVRTYFLDNK